MSSTNANIPKESRRASHSHPVEILGDGTHRHILGSPRPPKLQSLYSSLRHSILGFSRYGRSQPVQPESGSEPCAEPSFGQKYGRFERFLNYGHSNSVRLQSKAISNGSGDKRIYAVKVFHHCSLQNIDDDLRCSLCIAISLDHPNIVRCAEFLNDDHGELCLVMEYCTAGDMQSLIVASGKLCRIEADCFFKQLMCGVSYLHEHKIAHRNLNPENLLLTSSGVLKIADLDSLQWVEDGGQTLDNDRPGLPGMSPYFSPELCSNSSSAFDLRTSDIWAAGMIYMTIRTGKLLWKQANEDDTEYKKYISTRKGEDGYQPIQRLGRARCYNVIYAMLHPRPTFRLLASDVLRSEWLTEVVPCNLGSTVE